jgi:hypothetical protein
MRTSKVRRLGLAVWLLVAALLVSTPVTGASAQVATATLEGPITSPGGAFVASTTFPLEDVGYVQEEFFMSGMATSYASANPLTSDGKWTVSAAEMAPYKTRMLVYRPAKPKKFNGTVVVEWLNVSGGVDAAPDWTQGHVELIRDGFAWVGVSAQFAGVEGGGGLLPIVDLPLKKVNPARYGSLTHPGDSFSYDMYSQAGAAVRNPTGGVEPLGTLKVKRVIAVGESQSAFRMVNYINGVHPLAGVYDGFLVHSRGSGGAFGAPLSQAPQVVVDSPSPTLIRDDIDVPVLTLQTETDLTFLNYFPARQDDSKRFRLWEVAGTAHADAYTFAGQTDLGNSPDIVALTVTTSPVPGIITCNLPVNAGPQHFVVNAAFAAINRWVASGKPPKAAPRLEVTGPPAVIARDANGNAIGGIRTPQVDVPIAAFAETQFGSSITCLLFGTTTPFDASKLASLYPTHRAFVAAYKKAANRAVKRGFLRGPDAKLMKEWAARSDIGG